MNLVVLGLVALAAVAGVAVVAWWMRPSRAGRSAKPAAPPPVSPAAAAARQRALAPKAPAGAAVEPAPAPALPIRLAAFHPATLDALATDRQQALAAELRRIPRPPSALQQLTSPAFLERASSTELSDLIMAEGRIAAKVLATVNSPFYGLRQPVTSVGQAVTFLGLNSVRSLCLQALMEASFNPGQPDLRRRFDTIGRASAFASELCARLAPKLGMTAHGTLVTQLVLSFLGPMASAALMQPGPGSWSLEDDLLTRSEAEQAQLGLAAPALGSLLLHLWQLPASIVDEVAAIDAILVTPPPAGDSPLAMQRALAYLCARLGERLATGQLADPARFDPMADDSEAFFHLRGHLQRPALARLGDHLRSTDLGHAITAVARSVPRQAAALA